MTGEISSVELVRAHIERIEKTNPLLNAVVDLLRDPALVAARESDTRKEKAAPYDGVPFSIKDSIAVKGTVLFRRNSGLSQQPPASVRDATLVARLRAAGGIPLARTNFPDLLFAFESDNLIFGRTNNPYDLSRSSGGSSGGEAALIAAVRIAVWTGQRCGGQRARSRRIIAALHRSSRLPEGCRAPGMYRLPAAGSK